MGRQVFRGRPARLVCSLLFSHPSMSSSSSSSESDFYGFRALDIDGKEVPMSEFKDKVIVVVNVASQCGFTGGHYTQLEEIYQRYKDRGLEILAFPCNQFGKQEPGDTCAIRSFARDSKKATFKIFDKVDVNGKGSHPIFSFLKEKQHGWWTNEIKWNFTKFVIDREGNPVARYSPLTSPEGITSTIEKLL
eukprot:TRINITY_DN1228_c0_g1_i2.p1 TRINITY_DN1228_c0_g1~~TRINITY_DN1228_c0_g1_i2.p1  ORF type:complete len:191 (-),score=49.40 TRINITY_DN1228_c0_g1_i2:72-644(-)